MNPRVRIIIPAHDEALRITPTIEDYCAFFGASAVVVVVANGCTDETACVVRRLQERFANLRLIDIPSRVGKGGAVRAGLMTGDEPFIGFVDADHSTSAREFARLLEACDAPGIAGAIGSRWMKASRVEPRQPWKRRVASRAFNGLVRAVLGLRFRDTQCGAKVFTRAAIRRAAAGLRLADFAFDIDLLFGITRNGGRVVEVPTVWADHAAGTTVRLARASGKMFLSLLRVRLEHSFVARLPFLEFLAADSVIPMYRPPSILLLRGIGEASRTAALERAIFDLGASIAIEEPPLRIRSRRAALDRLRILWWYLAASHRRYDAVVESGAGAPFLIAAFSTKRTFVLAPSTPPAPVYRAYRRARVIDAARGAEAESELASRLRLATLRVAAFEDVGDGWLMHLGRAAGEERPIELR